MLSRIPIDELIESYIYNCLKENDYLKENVIAFDCQDTEDNNSTECYFYIKSGLSYHSLCLISNMIAQKLGVNPQCVQIENNDSHDGADTRIEFIVEIGDSNGRKFTNKRDFQEIHLT